MRMQITTEARNDGHATKNSTMLLRANDQQVWVECYRGRIHGYATTVFGSVFLSPESAESMLRKHLPFA